MMNIYAFLDTNNIPYERFDHPAAFTCEQADALCPTMPGASIKNLFLYDKRSDQHFLVVVGKEKQVDLKQLKFILDVSNLSFASPERLKKYLGVEPGSVTVLGLINDTTHAVKVIFDSNLKDKTLQCHPLVNTATLAIPFEGITKFLYITGHEYQFLDIPTR
ncbi:MAG TPA: prolyl-tRNA synthetase associated domain-containing protein [Candidatus Babeliales bacterium]|nr:prolyl-tRNA synthetase associated domain-containing protein [Candidatus Babeliales bacterium]